MRICPKFATQVLLPVLTRAQDKLVAFVDSFECAVLPPRETFVNQSESIELFVVIASGTVELTVRTDGEVAQACDSFHTRCLIALQRVELESGRSLGDTQIMYSSKSFAAHGK